MLERIHLAVVREVDRTGSLTAAARVLCLTQPALSHTIKKIEQQLGTPVWTREGRSLRLTQAGHYLLGVANLQRDTDNKLGKTENNFRKGK